MLYKYTRHEVICSHSDRCNNFYSAFTNPLSVVTKSLTDDDGYPRYPLILKKLVVACNCKDQYYPHKKIFRLGALKESNIMLLNTTDSEEGGKWFYDGDAVHFDEERKLDILCDYKAIFNDGVVAERENNKLIKDFMPAEIIKESIYIRIELARVSGFVGICKECKRGEEEERNLFLYVEESEYNREEVQRFKAIWTRCMHNQAVAYEHLNGIWNLSKKDQPRKRALGIKFDTNDKNIIPGNGVSGSLSVQGPGIVYQDGIFYRAEADCKGEKVAMTILPFFLWSYGMDDISVPKVF